MNVFYANATVQLHNQSGSENQKTSTEPEKPFMLLSDKTEVRL